ncbi:phospholipase [Amycolatopsis endophytica]|uniref:Phospholipase n=1 Tax=Amycolatopsis endophytica TaxID=860233 RepID=A0A853BDQ0_9PSEU|nr:phospholipase [Amycolatopsis endophytica]NYI92895.1 hypothetical protein [Amycolatopsis endophytica]
MRTAARLLSTAALATALVSGAGTAQAVDIESVTDTYLFGTSLSRFEQIRADQPYASSLDWSSDTCSWSPDKPFGFDFAPACHRHDFGYRNYKKQDRFTSTSRKKIDDNFYTDLKNICGSNVACKGTAWTYYQAVRQFGD